jgi:hypothetical protein
MEDIFSDKFEQFYTMQPATIVSFDTVENTLICTLDRGMIELRDIPITLLGSPTSYITTPTMVSGVKGLLIFSKHDISTWVGDGVDEHAKTDFSKNNAFFLIGATNQKNKISYNMNAIEIKTDKALEITAETHSSILSPKIALTNSATGDELFSLLEETLNEIKALATTLSQSKDIPTQNLLTNSVEIASYISKFGTLSTKYGGFKA